MKNQKQPIRILIPDGHSHLLTGVLMGLSEIKDLHIHVMTEEWFIPARLSRFVERIHTYPSGLAVKSWIGLINTLVRDYQIDVVMPVYDTAIRQLIAESELLLYPERILLPPSLSAFDQAKNKDLLASLLKEMGLPAPASWRLTADTTLDELPEEGMFPVFLKPTQRSGSGRGIKRFNSREALVEYLSCHSLQTPYFIQEYLQGYDLGCHVLCKNGEILAFTMQKGFLFSPRPYTPQVAMHMIYEDEVYMQIKALMKRLGWNGVADVDLRYDEKTGTFKILEINPRFWLTQHASVVAGVNFQWLYCLTVLGIPFEMPEYRRCDYHTWNGLRIELKKASGLFLKPRYIWNNTPVKFLFRDPGMVLFEFLQTLKIFLKSKLS